VRRAYLTDMAFRHASIVLFGLVAIATVLPTHAQTDDERYSIMRPENDAKPARPEPWLAPRYQSPRGTPQHVVIPRKTSPPQPKAQVPPPLYVPQTGQTLPNLPTIGSGPGGRETYQDRAARCTHQSGVYGQAAGDRNAYIGSCINQ